MALSLMDRVVAAGWDADHRLAAKGSFIAGVAGAVGVLLWFVVGSAASTDDQWLVVLVAGVMVLTDIAILVFMVGLAHAVARAGTFGVTVAVAVATLTTAVAATIHTVFGTTGLWSELPDAAMEFIGWLGSNLWLLSVYALLIGASLIALALPLQSSEFQAARTLATGYTGVGVVLCVLAPFSGIGDPMAGGMFLTVLTTLIVCVGVALLFVVTLVWLGRLLWATRRDSAHVPDGGTRR